MKRFSKLFFYLALFPAVLILAGWQGWRWWSWAVAPAAADVPTEAAVDQAVQVEIPTGTLPPEIGENLEELGIIRSKAAWDLWTRWRSLQDGSGGYQAGVYTISPSASMTEISDQIWSGEVTQLSYTIPEGWTLEQMGNYFEEQDFFSAEAFLQATEAVSRADYPWLPEDLPKLEGFLFPDTYVFEGTLTPELVVSQMLGQFEQVALPLYQENQGATAYTLLEWVTLASIVEKEAVVEAERPVIAGVFARRLTENIPLAADPTVEYGLGIRQTVDQPLTYAQVETPSPYNTYINPGLPPTPIAAPGVASLEVSLNPDDTEYLFFVARYDGTHIFSRTLAEHEAAKDAVDASLAEQSSTVTN
ncbi:endolytic transglycosylase MltG [Vacuolonema iberomarrocanum]|uniref:endolytic transglycosylase MltG n=1 Tax=Vacuolonema iberomarrocanum TaxID=3454632 RepID=UPI001A052309|nr:endolytic transglycosylase MltG [filamentous cyanobacterium LEGE 07170]